MVVVATAAVVVVAGIVAVVGAADTGRNMVGTSKEASCVLGAWDVDTRNSPPTIRTMAAAGLVRRSVQRRFIPDSFRLAASEPLRPGRTVCPGRPGWRWLAVVRGRGGRAKRYFHVSTKGVAAVARVQRCYQRLLKGVRLPGVSHA